MKLLSYRNNGSDSWGVITNDGIIDAGRHFECDLKGAIAEDLLGDVAEIAARATSRLTLDEVTLLPPIPCPEKIACIGVNYANRNAEYRDGSEAPSKPSLFMRTPDSLTAHGDYLLRPPESEQLDYEGEIVVVIGKQGRRISEDNAYNHIAGLTIMNEGTIRDWLRHSKFNVTQGKNFYHSGAIGPWIVTADDFDAGAYEDMRVITRVNGEERQNDTTANMMFPIRYLISYLSQFYLLKPGDLIATGTPNGAGARYDPPIWLKPGDIVEVEVNGIGTLRNEVMDEEV